MLETLTACPICKSPSIHKRRPSNHPASICECGQIFLNPRMSDKDTKAYYAGAYRDLVSGQGGVDIHNLIVQEKRSRIQVELCAEYLSKARTCLEIGSSAGYLLYRLETEFDIFGVGIEPDMRYHQLDHARNHQMYRDIAEVPPMHFDLFALSHSLEHLNHPLEYLRNLRDYYSNGNAMFMVEVPNVSVYVNTLSPHHPFAYNAETLDRLFARLGYVPLMHAYHNMEIDGKPLFLVAMYGVDNG